MRGCVHVHPQILEVPLTAQPSKVPIEVRYDRLINGTTTLQRLLNLEALSKMRKHSRSGAGLDTVVLKNFQNLQFNGPFTVGTQPFTAQFDTGSPWTWLPANPCQGCEQFGLRKSYTCALSPTCQARGHDIEIQYGKGHCRGKAFREQMTFSSNPQHVIKNVSLVLIDHIDNFAQLMADGIVGLSNGNNVDDENSSSIVTLMKGAGLIPEAAFSVYLSTQPLGSKLIFGGVNDGYKAGDFHFHPLASGIHAWMIKMTGDMLVGDKKIDNKPELALVDTGSSVLVFDPMTSVSFLSALESKNIFCEVRGDIGMRIFCTPTSESVHLQPGAFPPMSFSFDDITYTLEPELYAGQCDIKLPPAPSKAGCVLDVILLPMAPLVILGVPFIRKYYTIFSEEKQQVGFALAANNAIVKSESHGFSMPIWLVGTVGLIALVAAAIAAISLMKRYVQKPILLNSDAMHEEIELTPKFDS
jgi:hypothetical protein